jgi:serine/threonine protein kinase
LARAEAKAAAALNHPNIATVHEIGESDGVNFIAMEFIDGMTLRDRIHGERTELRSYCVTCNTSRKDWRRLTPPASSIAI